MELLKSIKASCGALKSRITINQSVAFRPAHLGHQLDFEREILTNGRLAIANEILPKCITEEIESRDGLTVDIRQSCYVFSKNELDEYTLAVYNLGIDSAKVL